MYIYIYIYIYIYAIPTNILHQKQTFFKQKCHAVHDHCAAYASSHRFAKTHTHTQKQKLHKSQQASGMLLRSGSRTPT